jgi:hypothetical protein
MCNHAVSWLLLRVAVKTFLFITTSKSRLAVNLILLEAYQVLYALSVMHDEIQEQHT